MTKQIVLASSSVNRKMLLQRLGVSFITINPEIDETPLPQESPVSLVKRLAKAKAMKVAEQFSNAIIIAADQVAFIDDNIYGKPGSKEQASVQLHLFSGRELHFITGLFVFGTDSGKMQITAIPSLIRFRKLTTAMIDKYIQNDNPIACAGSIKVESLGISLLENYSGPDPSALIGLPLMSLTRMLEIEGFNVI